jgi:hypothetical protein
VDQQGWLQAEIVATNIQLLGSPNGKKAAPQEVEAPEEEPDGDMPF